MLMNISKGTNLIFRAHVILKWQWGGFYCNKIFVEKVFVMWNYLFQLSPNAHKKFKKKCTDHKGDSLKMLSIGSIMKKNLHNTKTSIAKLELHNFFSILWIHMTLQNISVLLYLPNQLKVMSGWKQKFWMVL